MTTKKEPLVIVDGDVSAHYATVPVYALLSSHYGWDIMIDGEWLKYDALPVNWIHSNNHLFVNLKKAFPLD